MEPPVIVDTIHEGTRLLLGDAVNGQPMNTTVKSDYFLRVWIVDLLKWGLYRPERAVDPNELPNAVMSTEEMVERGFTLIRDLAPLADDKVFIYTVGQPWKEVPKGTDPLEQP
jgi:hypothetical protein